MSKGPYEKLVDRLFRAEREIRGARLSEQDVCRLCAILRITEARVHASFFDEDDE